ncbi:hypothetical protein, partial [uncultured Pedobacter sp.]|uniref:hypothetical protein n=1 Tax=uncultured Pedobacter sp. TaxID=246139 RepID=UPI0025D3BFF9
KQRFPYSLPLSRLLKIVIARRLFSADEAIFFAIFILNCFYLQERLLHATAHSPSSVSNDATNSSLRGGTTKQSFLLFLF